jgi:hypothetical protein
VRLRLPPRQPFDYQVRRDNFTWADHVLRVQLTGALISWFAPDTIIDPACGDGTIVAAAHRARPIEAARMADISRPNFYYVGGEMRGSLPSKMTVACQTIEETLAEDNFFDLIVLTEILEHVEDPTAILKMARKRANVVVASSPLFRDESRLDDNPEHLWQFDIEGYGEMIEEAGWAPITCLPVSLTPPQFIYDFQIWAAT